MLNGVSEKTHSIHADPRAFIFRKTGYREESQPPVDSWVSQQSMGSVRSQPPPLGSCQSGRSLGTSLLGGVPQRQVSMEPGQPQSSYSRKAGTGPGKAPGLVHSGEVIAHIG